MSNEEKPQDSARTWLTDEEMNEFINDEASKLTLETVTNLLAELQDMFPCEEKEPPIVRIVRLAKLFYISGFIKAAYCFNEALLEKEEESDHAEAQS